MAFREDVRGLGQVPVSLAGYVLGEPGVERGLVEELARAVGAQGAPGGLDSAYRRLDRVFIVPASTESEQPDWAELARVEFDHALDKLRRLQALLADVPGFGAVVFDTHAGLGSLSLAAAALADVNLIVLEEDDVSWRAALAMLLEITALGKRLGRKSASYFVANKVSTGFLDAAGKLKAFSFLPPILFDRGVNRLFCEDTASAFEREFENTNFFQHVHARVWGEIAGVLGMTASRPGNGSRLSRWWRKAAR